MTEVSEPVQAADRGGRRCQYSQCRDVLPNREGRGPKLRYCRDRRWDPDDRTCREMAATERATRRAAGGDAPLDTLAALADRVEQAGAPLVELYAQIQDTLDEAASTALAAAQQAHQHAAAEGQRAEQSASAANRAAEAQRQAEAARDRAMAQAQEAERRAGAARREADERVAAATERLATAERERGQAQATAAAAIAAAAEETRRREEADSAAAGAHAEAQALREQLDSARAGQAELRTQLVEVAGRAKHAEADNTRLHERVDAPTTRAAAAERHRRTTEHQRDVARAEAARVAKELDAARADTKTYTEKLATADARIDQLLAVLAAGPQQPAAPVAEEPLLPGPRPT